MTLGEKLQKLRKARGWTQEELAEKVGVSRQSLSKWESDGALPDTANVIVLADLFGVTTDYLLREEVQSDPAAPVASTPAASLHSPQKAGLSAAFVLGCILLVLGILVWLSFNIMSSIDPWVAYVDDMKYIGVQGYIRSHNVEFPYYAGIATIFIGAGIIAYPCLRRWIRRLVKHFAEADSTSP